ncbi:hypothetical protein DN508_36950, partial [Burkholderia multivorans]
MPTSQNRSIVGSEGRRGCGSRACGRRRRPPRREGGDDGRRRTARPARGARLHDRPRDPPTRLRRP